jgi:hypothetical protein
MCQISLAEYGGSQYIGLFFKRIGDTKSSVNATLEAVYYIIVKSIEFGALDRRGLTHYVFLRPERLLPPWEGYNTPPPPI